MLYAQRVSVQSDTTEDESLMSEGDGRRTIVVMVPVHLDFRDPVSAVIRTVCTRLEQSGKARSGTGDQVISAFNEAFNNLVIHGAGSSDDSRCQVEIELGPEQLILRLKDRGRGFDIEATRPDPTVSEPGEGGYGLHIIRSFMSEVRYMLGVNGKANVLTMVRSLERVR
jgi:serine/threonine-protein kinase RsbW